MLILALKDFGYILIKGVDERMIVCQKHGEVEEFVVLNGVDGLGLFCPFCVCDVLNNRIKNHLYE